jgi:hypothetical protein
MTLLTAILTQTLKSNGKWSAKRFTAFVAFDFSILFPVYALYKNGLTTEVVMLAGEFLVASMTLLGISTWQKIKQHLNPYSTLNTNVSPSNVCTDYPNCPNLGSLRSN